jgi:hypothetical protein
MRCCPLSRAPEFRATSFQTPWPEVMPADHHPSEFRKTVRGTTTSADTEVIEYAENIFGIDTV